MYMLKKKPDENEKQVLSNNKNKTLINNLIDQIKFLKNELWTWLWPPVPALAPALNLYLATPALHLYLPALPI